MSLSIETSIQELLQYKNSKYNVKLILRTLNLVIHNSNRKFSIDTNFIFIIDEILV